MNALELRAERFKNGEQTEETADDRLFRDAIDDTGTVPTIKLTERETESLGTMVEFSELKEVRESVHELLRVHGTIPKKKAEGIIRLIYENLNGINNRISNNDKLDKAKQVIDDLSADIVAYNEL